MINFKRIDARKVGQIEESRTITYFKRLGWNFLDRNFSCPLGEVDLIFKDPEGAIVFMEVKYRSGQNYGGAIWAVTPAKQKRVAKAALFYIKQYGLQNHVFRFDVAAVGPAGIEHIPNAFSSSLYTL